VATARYLSTPAIGAMAFGAGQPVRIAINDSGDLRHGLVDMGRAVSHGWYAIKSDFVSAPAYQGPFLIRAKRLDRPGPIRLGATPSQRSWTIVPAGPTVNGAAGWRDVPAETFVKAPGCYGWEADGLTFSETIIVRVLPPLHSPRMQARQQTSPSSRET
jgi:hypothetical protein